MAKDKKYMTYSEKLKDPRWQKKRLKTLERDGFKCTYCGDEETTLHVHHKKYTGEPWEAPNKDLETVCEDCHSVIGDIESVINDDYLDCIDIFKEKHKDSFSLLFIFKKGISILTSGHNDHISFVGKKNLDNILKTINNS